jgi:hypothetical protein
MRDEDCLLLVLSEGDRVHWHTDLDRTGEVLQVDGTESKVQWDDWDVKARWYMNLNLRKIK